MYKFLVIFISLLLVFSICLCAYADEFEIEDTTDYSEDDSEDDPATEYTDPIPSNVTPIFSVVGPVTPSNTSGLKAALLRVIGNYDPIVAEYSYTSSNGYINYVREIEPDYIWIWSVVLLCLVIFCLFRLLGGIFNGKR